jgi:hypothetical protein
MQKITWNTDFLSWSALNLIVLNTFFESKNSTSHYLSFKTSEFSSYYPDYRISFIKVLFIDHLISNSVVIH